MIPQAPSHVSVTTCLTSTGAIYASGSSVFVGKGTLFVFNNASTGSGGGVYASSSVMFLKEAVFTKNHGARGGGRSLRNSYKYDAF